MQHARAARDLRADGCRVRTQPLVRTGAFAPLGRTTEIAKGQVKANGTILRTNADGSALQVPVEKPLTNRPLHAGVTRIDFSRNEAFGYDGRMFLGEVGSGAPATGPETEPAGFQVVVIDLKTGKAEPFFRAKPTALGPKGQEYVATAAPKRPVDVRFSPDGSALYVVDIGALTGFPAGAGPVVRPFPGSGVVWRIVRDGTISSGPTNLSPIPRADAGR